MEKEILKGWWVIANVEGKAMPYTLNAYRRNCINEFVGDSSYPWEYWKKHGMKCVKVQITFEEFSKQ